MNKRMAFWLTAALAAGMAARFGLVKVMWMVRDREARQTEVAPTNQGSGVSEENMAWYNKWVKLTPGNNWRLDTAPGGVTVEFPVEAQVEKMEVFRDGISIKGETPVMSDDRRRAAMKLPDGLGKGEYEATYTVCLFEGDREPDDCVDGGWKFTVE